MRSLVACFSSLPWVCSIKFYEKHEVQKLRAAEETNVRGTDPRLRFILSSGIFGHSSARETSCRSSGSFVASLAKVLGTFN